MSAPLRKSVRDLPKNVIVPIHDIHHDYNVRCFLHDEMRIFRDGARWTIARDNAMRRSFFRGAVRDRATTTKTKSSDDVQRNCGDIRV